MEVLENLFDITNFEIRQWKGPSNKQISEWIGEENSNYAQRDQSEKFDFRDLSLKLSPSSNRRSYTSKN